MAGCPVRGDKPVRLPGSNLYQGSSTEVLRRTMESRGAGGRRQPFLDLLQPTPPVIPSADANCIPRGAKFDSKSDDVLLPRYDAAPARPGSPPSSYEQICRPRDPPVTYEKYESASSRQEHDSATLASAHKRTMKTYADNPSGRLSQLEATTQTFPGGSASSHTPKAWTAACGSEVMQSGSPATAFAVVFAALLLTTTTSALRPPQPAQCNAGGQCTVSNYLGSWTCRVAKVVHPRDEAELVAAVTAAVAQGRKIRAVSRWSQSLPELACPGNEGVVISTGFMDSSVRVDVEAATAEVDAGVLLKDLVVAIAKVGFAIPAATYWAGVSVGGAIATGAHGSRLFGLGGALHDHVVAISLVVANDSSAQVLRLVDGDPLLEAARLSLGSLGIMSKVVFKLEPMFKRSVSLELLDDDGLVDKLWSLAEEVEFGDICWHPSLRKMLVKLDTRVPMDVPGNGVNKYRGFQPMEASFVQRSRLAEERFQESMDSQSLCSLAKTILNTRIPSGNGYLNDGVSFTGFPVIGFNHLMQTSSGCEEGAEHSEQQPAYPTSLCASEEHLEQAGANSKVCSWDVRINGTFYHQVAMSVPLDEVSDFVADIKKLRDMEPDSLCGLSLYGGIYLRFVKASTAYLGQKSDAIEFDFTFYRPRDSNRARMKQDVLDEIEQIGLLKYHGKPHWGKNRNIGFLSMANKVKDMDRFLEAKKQLDPAGYFSNDWTEAVLSGRMDRILSSSDHCALEGRCICSEDRHCAPAQGYLCRSGKVFEDARVCRLVTTEVVSSAEEVQHGDGDDQPPEPVVLSDSSKVDCIL